MLNALVIQISKFNGKFLFLNYVLQKTLGEKTSKIIEERYTFYAIIGRPHANLCRMDSVA